MTEVHEALLSEWKSREWHRDPGFVRDGILDEVRWKSGRMSSRVVFILKEAYDTRPVREDWDLRSLIRDDWQGPRGSMWEAVARWAHLVQELDEPEPTPFDSLLLDGNAAKEALLSSAVVNVKKSKGTTTSLDDDLATWVERDGDLIRRQIDLIDGDVLIFGHTWKYVSKLWPDRIPIGRFTYRTGRQVIVDFWHPATRRHVIMNKHYGLLFQWLKETRNDSQR